MSLVTECLFLKLCTLSDGGDTSAESAEILMTMIDNNDLSVETIIGWLLNQSEGEDNLKIERYARILAKICFQRPSVFTRLEKELQGIYKDNSIYKFMRIVCCELGKC